MSLTEDNHKVYERDIDRAISYDVDLRKRIKEYSSIAIVEYNGKDISGSRAIAGFLKENCGSTAAVKRITLLGSTHEITAYNVKELPELFPDAQISAPNLVWTDWNIRNSNITEKLAFHVLTALDINDVSFLTIRIDRLGGYEEDDNTEEIERKRKNKVYAQTERLYDYFESQKGKSSYCIIRKAIRETPDMPKCNCISKLL